MNPGMMFIRRTLYELKKKYGAKLDVYRTLVMDVNQKTGVRTVTREKISIRKAIMLPLSLAHKITIYVISRTFPSGGEYHLNNRLVIVDSVDLPKDFQIQIDDFCIIDGHRFEMGSLEILEGNFAYLLTLTETVGTKPTALLLPVSYNQFQMHDQVTYEMGHWVAGVANNDFVINDAATGST